MRQIFLTMLFFILAFPTIWASTHRVNYDYILVVDVSGSMKRGDLYKKVKKAFKEYVSDFQIGDRVILMTFGNDVNAGRADITIRRVEDIREIQKEIDRFKFNDQYTWMTKAFDVIGRRLRDLQKAYPERPKKVLIFTDGKNEPPPGHEDDFTFSQILNKYFTTYKKLNTFVYVVLLGEKPQKDLQNMENKGMINIIESERELPRLVQEVILSPQSFSISSPLRNTIKRKIILNVEKIVNINQKVPLDLVPQTTSEFQIEISPTKFNIRKESQKLTFNLSIINIKDPGKYSFYIFPKTSIKGIIVHPYKIAFNINIKKPSIPFLKLSPENLSLKLNLKNKLRKEIKLKVKKFSSVNPIPIILKVSEISDLNVKVFPEQFVVEREGQEIPIVLTITGIRTPGTYSSNFTLIPQIEKAIIQPSQINLNIKIRKPFKIPIWLWVGIIGIIVILGGALIYHYFIPKFDKEYLVLINDRGEEVMRSRLRNKQPFFSSKIIISKHLKISGLSSSAFYIRKDKKGRIYIRGLQNGVKIGREEPIKGKELRVERQDIFEVNNRKFKIEGR